MSRYRSRRGVCAALAPASLVLSGALLVGACEGAPTGSVYITSGRTDEIIRLDASDGRELARINVDRRRHEADEPHAVAVAPDGSYWYATVAHGEPSLWKFETGSDRLVGRVDLTSGGAAMIALTPDGSTAYVPDYDRAGERAGRVAAIRLHDLAVVANEAVCDAPHDASVHPNGDLVAVACAGGDEVVLLDRELRVLRRIAAPMVAGADGHDAAGHMPPGGSRPLSLAWSNDGARLAVALHSAGRVWLLDRDGRTHGLFEVGAGPAQLVFIGEASVVTANRFDGSLSLLDLETGDERRVALPIEFPHGVAVADGIAYVACEGGARTEGGAVAVDLESLELLWQRRAGRYVLGVAYVPD